MTLSIVILNWNNRKLLKQCLLTIDQFKPNIPYEIIVVDNNSEDESQKMVKTEFPNVHLIENDTNTGYAKGNNVGIRKATGEYTLLLNEDIEFVDNTIQTLIEFLDTHPNTGAVAPKLQYPDGLTQYSCRTFPRIWPLYKQLATDLHLRPPNKKWAEYKMSYWKHNDTQTVDQPMTSAILIRTDILKKLHGFDEQFINYFNDVDLCYRIKHDLQKEIYFIGDKGHVIHHHGKGMKALKWKRVKFWNQGIRRFYKKHYIKSSFSIKYILLNIGLALRTSVLVLQYGILKNKSKY